MRIGNSDLSEKVFIIAEVGNNHEGDFSLAQRMVALAARAGVDAVKFQTIRPERFCSRKNEQRFQTLKRFELSDEQFSKLAETARDEGIHFMSTPFDIESVDMLDALVPVFKIASGDMLFFPLLKKIARTKKPVIMSTGMANLEEVRQARGAIEDVWRTQNINPGIVLLHCVVSYPTPINEANLQAIATLRGEFGDLVGYSDHTLGIDAAVLSVALGARVIEKHFTIDKNHSTFRDHQLSADPAEMQALVERVRIASELLGSGQKSAGASESANIGPVRRSIVAARTLAVGHVLAADDLTWMRPGDGIAPGKEDLLIGKKLKIALECGDLIRLDDLSV